MEHPVVIAGAGPVGLMLAGELTLAGVPVLVLERRPAGAGEELTAGAMGARSVSAPTADAFHRRGLLPAVRDAAIWWFDPAQRPGPGGGERAAARGERAEAGAGPSAGEHGEQQHAGQPPVFAGHFAGLMIRADRLDLTDAALAGDTLGGGVISQQQLEGILAERAVSLGAEIRRGTELTGLEAGPDGVTVLAGGQRITADWLVGCDGGRSAVRKLAGFAFPGLGPEFTGRQALVELAEPAAVPFGDWIRTPAGAYAHGPVPGRIHTVQYESPPADPRAPVTAAELRDSLRAVSGIDAEITRVLAATRYTDQTRQAAAYRRGRVLLAGDAAHVHSPAGGQGLNLGIGDAMNLGWKLAATVRGWAPAGLLDSYTAERHPAGAWVQQWSSAQTALGRPDPRTAALRAVVADLLDTSAGATYVLRQISGLAQRYELAGEHPLTGRRAPEIRLAGGQTLAGRGQDGRALLAGFGGQPGLAELGARWAGRLTVLDEAVTEPVSPGASGPGRLSALLVRPDGYVAWAADGEPDLGAARAALTAWLGAAA
ncbi:MAG TPA: FAD-dependent monooxygenase [Streptosporangiaceae bacterium]|nr:FAD-dependent monooxygenase [Streptosporangiaceae bacterium]